MQKLVILDIEATGLHKEDRDDILELHARVVDTKTLVQEGSFWVLPWAPSSTPMDDFVTQMHSQNGLLLERNERSKHPPRGRAPEVMRADGENVNFMPGLPSLQQTSIALCEWLRKHQVDGDPRSLVLTGNSLANFDIPMLRTYLRPVFNEMHYRIYDVSVARTHHREILGQTLPPKIEQQITGGGTVEATHRAADDTRICLRTIRMMRAWAQQGYPEVPSTVDTLWHADWSHPQDKD